MKKRYPTNWDDVPLVLDFPYVSIILGVYPETVRRKLSTGEIKGRKVGREWRVLKDDLVEFLKRTEVKSK